MMIAAERIEMDDSPIEVASARPVVSQEESPNFSGQWVNGLRVEHIAHSKTASSFASRGRALGVATIVLSALVGAGIFSALGAEPSTWVRVTAGLCSFLAAALAGAQTFLKYPELAESHRRAAASFGAIRRDLEAELTAPKPSQKRLETVRQRWNALEESVPPVPPRMHKAALRRVKPARPLAVAKGPDR